MSQACSACHNESETVKLLCIECQGVNCTNCTKRVENAVLAYCQQFQESFNVDEMANALYVHFSEEDILKARQLLRDSCSGLLMNHIIMTVGCRRGTDARPAAEVSAMDIASAMYSIVHCVGPESTSYFETYCHQCTICNQPEAFNVGKYVEKNV